MVSAYADLRMMARHTTVAAGPDDLPKARAPPRRGVRRTHFSRRGPDRPMSRALTQTTQNEVGSVSRASRGGWLSEARGDVHVHTLRPWRGALDLTPAPDPPAASPSSPFLLRCDAGARRRQATAVQAALIFVQTQALGPRFEFCLNKLNGAKGARERRNELRRVALCPWLRLSPNSKA